MKASENIYERIFDVKGKTIAIIGATGLLGTQYVHTLSEAGARIIIGDLSLERCRRLADETEEAYGSRNIPMEVDNTNEESIGSFFEGVKERAETLDVLINNAQVKPEGFYSPLERYPKKAMMEVLDGNLGGVVMACKTACNLFFVKQSRGNIVNIASTYGLVGADQRIYDGVKNIYFPGERFSSPVSYAVTKAGVVNLTRYLASYYRESNIRVNCLTPGGVFDNHDDLFVKNYSYRTILGRMADRTEYNGAILYLCSDASSYMTGSNLVVDGGWTAV